MNMNFFNIKRVAHYEAKIVRRNWLFRTFALFSLVGILILQILVQSNIMQWTSWNTIALSSYVPYFNVYLFGIVQAVLVVFFTVIQWDKDRNRVETTCVRSLSNAEYVIGKACGMIQVFMALSLLSLLSGAIINIFFTNAPFNGWMYFFYWIVFLFPSLVFIIGLTFLCTGLVSDKPLLVLELLLYIFITLYYSDDYYQGLFNFLGGGVPVTLSDISGYPDLGGVMLQRLSWLFLGMGFIGYSGVFFKCLPIRTGRVAGLGVSTFIVVLGLICGFSLCMRQYRYVTLRDDYRATYEKYRSNRKLTQCNQVITYRQEEDQLTVKTRLRLKNEYKETVNPVLLYLNPGLRVNRICINGERVDFYRDNQVIVLNEAVEGKGLLDLEVEYSGRIDESICYLQLCDNYVANTWNVGSELFRSGKRYAILEKEYTLLTPECIWYPVSVPPVNPSDVYAVEKNFTKYGLKVVGETDRTVLSQGDRIESNDTLIFRNEHRLSGISLCIGDYKCYQMQVDSVFYELFVVEGHDDFMEHFNRIKDSMTGIIREFRDKIEKKNNRKYPYERFMVVETPVAFAAYFQSERGGGGKVQPEMIFLPERGVGFKNMDLARNKQTYRKITNEEKMENVERSILTQLLNHIFISEYGSFMEKNPLMRLFVPYSYGSYTLSGSPFTLNPLFYNHVNQLYSREYPILDAVLNNLLNGADTVQFDRIDNFEVSSRSHQLAVNYLKSHSLKEALRDPGVTSDVLYQLIKLKSVALRESYLGLTVSYFDFNAFIRQYWEDHKFQKIDFTSFDKEFTERFGISWCRVLPEWYTVKQIPSFVVQDACVEEIAEKGDRSSVDRRYRIHVNVYNESEVEGVVVLTYAKLPEIGSNSKIMSLYTKNVLIEAKKAKEIVIVTEGKPTSVFLNTILSGNIPALIPIEYSGKVTYEANPGVRDIDVSRFFPQEGEWIVDNESGGFSIWQAATGDRTPGWLKPVSFADTYDTYNVMMASGVWSLVTHYGFYGRRVRSGWMKNCGGGASKAKWSVKIEKSGYYEVLVHIPKYVGLQRVKRLPGGFFVPSSISDRELKQNYIVRHDGQETEVSAAIVSLEDWVSLGRFYFSSGEASVVLTDQGSVDDQIIYADAVKWVFNGENEVPER
ncbi:MULTISPECIES: hypothetical protein [Sanguibacteroides]|uniref:Xanthan lyase n=2 Tax=Sanguibacteroides justesenii TaxID=1547597 RepID=A0A0C3NDK7_9PORP|nr:MULTISPECIES: hypothetical protein [Sanguibacteroides]KIO44192.1 hypothetical protein BA92_12545 [Sanguibacteroides justesenii]KIO47151.1 hypothetical protein IE90_00690 [Sanguibacteroides justesenii]PXZ43781.1 hypothetical protein DMB45_07260 [Sanguibacteroides justesenii]